MDHWGRRRKLSGAAMGQLDRFRKRDCRYAFRKHYRVAPWSDHMELHWGRYGEIYVTPVSPEQVCVALISRDPKLRLEEALRLFPELQARLSGAEAGSTERGALTATSKLKHVSRGNVALIGDASGTVDAITGEGLCLTFSQALVLADCLRTGDLSRYEREHRRLALRPLLDGATDVVARWTSAAAAPHVAGLPETPVCFPTVVGVARWSVVAFTACRRWVSPWDGGCSPHNVMKASRSAFNNSNAWRILLVASLMLVGGAVSQHRRTLHFSLIPRKQR